MLVVAAANAAIRCVGPYGGGLTAKIAGAIRAGCSGRTGTTRMVFRTPVRIKDQSEEAMDSARIWSILYICDQHLAILYDRPAIIQDDWLTQDWEGILNCPLATDQDERLMSQVELMGILRNIRRLFGPDKGEEIPRLYLSQIGHYHRQLDQWITKWTDRLPSE